MDTAYVLGIDPGMSGCAVILSWADGKVFLTIPFNKHTLKDVADILTEYRLDILYAAIEQVHAMPGQGVSSTFKFGRSFGEVVGVLTALRIPYEFVSPAVWQKAMQCASKGDKNVTKQAAQRLFPNERITHQNADALLIAEWIRRKTKGMFDGKSQTC